MVGLVRMVPAAAVLVTAAGVFVAPAASAEPYPNCTEAHKNGDYNIPRSSDKYSPKLNRDGDGLACEPKPRR